MRTKVAVVVVVALSACYPEPQREAFAPALTTSCGLTLRDGDALDLQRLQRQQDITLEALSRVHTNVQWTPKITCDQLRGTSVYVQPLADGGTWSDDQFFELKRGFDRGRYNAPYQVVVTTSRWADPELSWQLVRIITRGSGDVDDLLWVTAPAIADAAKMGREVEHVAKLEEEQP